MKPLLDEQTRALFQVGFIRPIDFFASGSIIATVITTFFWWAFGTPTWQNLVMVMLGVLLVLAVWIAILVYRCCYHVIMARSEINTMPEAAAKLAVSYQIGVRTPPS
jgi:branched-subunit amino acid ABC-type transport system permease component